MTPDNTMNIESAVRAHLKTFDGWNNPQTPKLILGGLNSSPVDQIAIIDTNGPGPDIDVPLEDVTFQFMIRSTKSTDGRFWKEVIKALFHATSFTSEEIVFRSVFAISSGGPLGRDEKGAYLHSINFTANVINPMLQDRMDV